MLLRHTDDVAVPPLADLSLGDREEALDDEFLGDTRVEQVQGQPDSSPGITDESQVQEEVDEPTGFDGTHRATTRKRRNLTGRGRCSSIATRSWDRRWSADCMYSRNASGVSHHVTIE